MEIGKEGRQGKRSLVDAITMGIETTRKLHEKLVTAQQREETPIHRIEM